MRSLPVDPPDFAVRVLVCGDRRWSDRELVRSTIAMLPKATVVIHGAEPGAATVAGEVARELGFSVEAYPADWARGGPAAGVIRRIRMTKEGRPDAVYAFDDALLVSHGHVYAFHNGRLTARDTAHTISMARKEGVPSFLVSHDSDEPREIL